MDRRGVRVVMAGPDPAGRGGIATLEKMCIVNMPHDVAISHVVTVRPGSTASKVGLFVRALVRFWWITGRERCDVVHLPFASRGSTVRKAVLAWTATRRGKPVILHALGGGFESSFLGMPAFVRKLVRGAARNSACLVVPSESWARVYGQLLDLPASQVVVLPNPVAFPGALARDASTDEVQVLCVGRLAAEKGVYEGIRAFAAACEVSDRRLSLTLVGEGETGELVALARSLGVEDKVQFAGWVDETEKERLLTTCDIYMLPSRVEGVPLALLEAMAHGAACVATRIGGVPDVIVDGETGLLVEPGDTIAMRDALLVLSQSEVLRENLGAAARQRAAAFDIGLYAARLANLYRRLRGHSAASIGNAGEHLG